MPLMTSRVASAQMLADRPLLPLALVIVMLASACRAKEASLPSLAGDSSFQQPDTAVVRRFSRLGIAMVDLKREIWARTAGVIVRETVVEAPPPGAPPWMIPNAPQHPIPTAQGSDLALPPSSPAARRLRQRTEVAFTGQDGSEGRFGRWLESEGFRRPTMINGDLSPNQIVFGDSVPLEDIKAIALQLYVEKMPPVSIRRFASGNSFRIELRGIPYLADIAPLSLPQIRAMRIAGPKED
jgi:hypothetical protein